MPELANLIEPYTRAHYLDVAYKIQKVFEAELPSKTTKYPTPLKPTVINSSEPIRDMNALEVKQRLLKLITDLSQEDKIRLLTIIVKKLGIDKNMIDCNKSLSELYSAKKK